MRTVIKQDLSPHIDPFGYAIWVILENKTTATSHPNISSHMTAFEEKWNKMSEEIISKACKWFRRRFDAMIKKNDAHIE